MLCGYGRVHGNHLQPNGGGKRSILFLSTIMQFKSKKKAKLEYLLHVFVVLFLSILVAACFHLETQQDLEKIDFCHSGSSIQSCVYPYFDYGRPVHLVTVAFAVRVLFSGFFLVKNISSPLPFTPPCNAGKNKQNQRPGRREAPFPGNFVTFMKIL